MQCLTEGRRKLRKEALEIHFFNEDILTLNFWIAQDKDLGPVSGEYFFISFILNHKARILPSPPSLHAARAAIVRVRSWIRYDDSSIQQFEETAKDSKLGCANRVLPKPSLNDHPQRGSFRKEPKKEGWSA